MVLKPLRGTEVAPVPSSGAKAADLTGHFAGGHDWSGLRQYPASKPAAKKKKRGQ